MAGTSQSHNQAVTAKLPNHVIRVAVPQSGRDSPAITLKSDYPSLLNLFFAIGSTTKKSIAFEASDHEVFGRAIHLQNRTSTPGDILKQALKTFPAYCATDQIRLLRIAHCGTPKQTWLDYWINSISWGRNFLQAMSNGV